MFENNYYRNKVVLITGSSMGIGKELAKQVLERGGKVFLTGRNLIKLKETFNEFKDHKNSLGFMDCDASNYENNILLIKEVLKCFGKLDIVITNAGMSCYGEVDKLDPKVAKQVIDINIYGSLFPIMAALDELKKSKGSITFISSIAGFSGIPAYSSYSLSKMALTALAQSLSIELKRHQVKVQIAYVGFTENEVAKVTLSPNGVEEKVPYRPKLLTASRYKTALRILEQTERAKFSRSYSFIGKLTNLMSRHLPSFVKFSMQKNYDRNIKIKS